MSGRRRVRDLPLRVTLVAALLALVALGLLASGVAATTALSTSLLQRTDAQLTVDAEAYAGPGRGGGPPGPLDGDRDADNRPAERYYVVFTDAGGAVEGTLPGPTAGGEPAPDLTGLHAVTGGAGVDPVTVGSVDGDDDWRVVVVADRITGGTTTVAASLEDNAATVRTLVQLQVVIGLVVLALLAGLASLVVRRSLRPLAEVERTAAAIAGGDLDQRVPDRSPRTEVGRLGAALNGMLGQIQTAVDASAAAARDADTAALAARSSEERMRRFVGDASHELRTPLTTIRGFAELYRQGAATDPAAVARILGRIEGEAQRMGLLTDDLLLLARLDAQRPLERRPVDLLVLASDAVHDARAVAPDRHVALAVVDGPGTPEVLGDEARLRQVLGNLVTNALTHTPAGAAVTVRVGTDAAGALLEVADTGPGLAPADAERVFERFYRADASRTRASGGTGLGLSIVAALVAAHGGTVAVDSAPGRGATFRVHLPRVGPPGPLDPGRGAAPG